MRLRVVGMRALKRLAADPAARAAFNSARLSPEAANLIAKCRARTATVDDLEACLRAWGGVG